MHNPEQVLPAADTAAPTANLPFLPLQLPMLMLVLVLVLLMLLMLALGLLPVVLADACPSWHCCHCSSCCSCRGRGRSL
jgi:hypothetical protein